jgi:hypothetical protein
MIMKTTTKRSPSRQRPGRPWTRSPSGRTSTDDNDNDDDDDCDDYHHDNNGDVRLGGALGRVALWRGRVGTGGEGGGGASLPPAVEATASLAGALYSDRRRRVAGFDCVLGA